MSDQLIDDLGVILSERSATGGRKPSLVVGFHRLLVPPVLTRTKNTVGLQGIGDCALLR